jgi:predicted DNA-binding transcriptional regulator AlpA
MRPLKYRRLEPRCLSREEAADYIGGLSPTFFDQLVADGRMPQPIRINSRRVWDRRQLDQAIDVLRGAGGDGTDDWKVAV